MNEPNFLESVWGSGMEFDMVSANDKWQDCMPVIYMGWGDIQR